MALESLKFLALIKPLLYDSRAQDYHAAQR
jgi:hypothetical protein